MRKIIITIIILGALAGGAYYFCDNLLKPAVTQSANTGSGATAEAIAEIKSYQYTETHAQPAYNFSFKYPKEFMVSEVPDANGGDAILVQNTATNIGVQILVTPFEGQDINVTEAVIRGDIPDMQMSEAQEILIGDTRKGLAFVSDNESFGGKSREVWFVYGGNLYQISTYYELDGFLKGLFGTWEFTQ